MTEDDTFRRLMRPSLEEMRVIIFETRCEELRGMLLRDFQAEIRKLGWDPKILPKELQATSERNRYF